MPNGSQETCYDNEATVYGWCGICDLNETDNCQNLSAEALWGFGRDSPHLSGASSLQPDKNWGWCDKTCFSRLGISTSAATMLQVAFVDVLSRGDCVRIT